MDYALITSEQDLRDYCDELLEAPIVAVDTETEGIEYGDIIVGIALSCREGTGRYVPMRHEAIDGVRYPNQLDPEVVYEILGPVLEKVPCTGHNVKFDDKAFLKDGVKVNFVHDTLIMANIGNFSYNNSKGLKQLVAGEFQHQMNDIDSLFPKVGSKKPQIRPKILAPEDIEFYGCEDGNWSLRLFNRLYKKLSKVPQLMFVYQTEMRLIHVVSEMESFGIPVSTDFLQTNSKRARAYAKSLEDDILAEIREELDDPEFEINFGSPAQLGKLLYTYLGLPVLSYTKTGNPSTAADVLDKLSEQSPLVHRIKTLRELKKLDSTYLYGLQSAVHTDNRIRGNFNQVGTASGRFSSSNPNLQNLPNHQTFALWPVPDDVQADVVEHFDNKVREKEGKWQAYNTQSGLWGDGYMGSFGESEYGVHKGRLFEMWRCKTRNFIEAPPDHYLIEADYSQVELRILCGEAQEKQLLEAYRTGADVHRQTAAIIFDLEFEQVTNAQRHIGKTINFSLLYGAGPYNIAMQLGIEVEQAQDIVNKYFEGLPNIRSWINRVKQDSRMDGYAETVFGRRRYFPDIRSSNRKLAEKSLRESVNHCIQGSAADVMKIALVRAHKYLRERFGDSVKIISTVHDSVLVECHNSCDVDEVLAVLRDAMENITKEPAQLRALKEGKEIEGGITVVNGWPRLLIDAKVGPSWGEAEDWDFKDDVAPPPKVDVSKLPKVRVRKIAHEREQYAPEDVKWSIEVDENSLTKNWKKLNNFLDGRKVVRGGKVGLIVASEDGKITTKDLDGSYELSLADNKSLAKLLGEARIVQTQPDLDYGDVLKGVDFNL